MGNVKRDQVFTFGQYREYAMSSFAEKCRNRKCGLLAMNSGNNTWSTPVGMWYGMSYCVVKSHIDLLRSAFSIRAFINELKKCSCCGKLGKFSSTF